MMKIGKYIKEYRNERGMSLRKFSEVCGVSASHLNGLEKGRYEKVNADTLAKIAKGMGLTASELLDILEGESVDMNKSVIYQLVKSVEYGIESGCKYALLKKNIIQGILECDNRRISKLSRCALFEFGVDVDE